MGNGFHTWLHIGCVHVTAGSSTYMDDDTPRDSILIKQGSPEASTIRDVTDSKLCTQVNKLRERANNSPTKSVSPGPVASTTLEREPILLATLSPENTEITQSRKRNLSDDLPKDVVPEIGNEKLEETANLFHEQLV